MPPTEEEVLISWKAPRYKDIKSDIVQDIIVFGLMGLFFIVGLVRGDVTIILISAIAAFTIHQFSHKTPPKELIEVTNRGVRVGKEFYPYSKLESFWIMDEVEHHDLLLRKKGSSLSRVDIYMGNADEIDVNIENLRETLKEFLEEREESRYGLETIGRWLGY